MPVNGANARDQGHSTWAPCKIYYSYPVSLQNAAPWYLITNEDIVSDFTSLGITSPTNVGSATMIGMLRNGMRSHNFSSARSLKTPRISDNSVSLAHDYDRRGRSHHLTIVHHALCPNAGPGRRLRSSPRYAAAVIRT